TPPAPPLFPYTTLFRSDPFRRELLRGLQRKLDHAREGDDGDVLARPHHPGLADRHDPILGVRHRVALAVDELMLEEDHRIGVPRSEEHTSELQSRENLV